MDRLFAAGARGVMFDLSATRRMTVTRSSAPRSIGIETA